MSASVVGSECFIPNFEGCKSSGGMNVNVPPSSCTLHDIGARGSRTIAMKPKSARQARGGVSLVTKMFALKLSGAKDGCGTEWY